MDVTREELAKALDGLWVYAKNREGTHHGQVADPVPVSYELWEHLLTEPEPPREVVDAHICCEHVDTDAEVTAMAALLPALPLVSRLGVDARERVMDWARRRACDGLPPV